MPSAVSTVGNHLVSNLNAATKKILHKPTSLRSHHGKSSKHRPSSLTSSSTDSLSIHSEYSSDPEDMDLLKRHNISIGRNRRDSHDVVPAKTAVLDFAVESPPLISHGPAEDSSGAIFSGQLRVSVLKKPQTFTSISVKLQCVRTIRKPVITTCHGCSGTTTELSSWDFTPQPLTLDVGEHKFPISYLFPGDAAPTSHCRLLMLDYNFVATYTTASGETNSHTHTVELHRALRPGLDRQSIRVFPPTNMTANVTLMPVCYSNSEIPVKLRLDGIQSANEKSLVRWRMRRLLWRIEEYQKITSPACAKHAAKAPDGHKHDEVRVLGESEVSFSKNPWKTDFSSGEITSEFTAKMNPNKHAHEVVSDPVSSLSIYHHLVLELIVVEEFVPRRKPNSTPTPTGGARILRSQFPLRVTNRAGLGVAWDEETPPVYQDVPPSPPGYSGSGVAGPSTPGLATVIEVPMEEVEELRLGEPQMTWAVGRRSEERHRFGVDDLMSGPPEYPRREEEEEIDIETVRVRQR